MCTEHMDLFLFCILSTNHCIGFLDLDLLNLWHDELQVCVGPQLYFYLPQGRLIGYWDLLFSWPRSFTYCFYHNYLACYLTFWRYVTFACPDPWGGDGVVFADPAHARTFFLNTNLPRHFCLTRWSGFFLDALNVPEEVAKTMTSTCNIPAC